MIWLNFPFVFLLENIQRTPIVILINLLLVCQEFGKPREIREDKIKSATEKDLWRRYVLFYVVIGLDNCKKTSVLEMLSCLFEKSGCIFIEWRDFIWILGNIVALP